MTDKVAQIEQLRMELQRDLQLIRNAVGEKLVDLKADDIGGLITREVGAFFGDTIWVVVQHQDPAIFDEEHTPDVLADFLFEEGVKRAGAVYTQLDSNVMIAPICEDGMH